MPARFGLCRSERASDQPQARVRPLRQLQAQRDLVEAQLQATRARAAVAAGESFDISEFEAEIARSQAALDKATQEVSDAERGVQRAQPAAPAP